jgi:TRAP-type C4-dicarboxylate transport system permease small subunit
MPDSLRRAIRTFIQAFIGAFVLFGLPVLQGIMDAAKGGENPVLDLSVWMRVLVICVISGVIALVSWVQNWFEDNTKTPALLKAPPSAGQNPAPNDGGTTR